MFKDGEKVGLGSGVLVGNGIVITANHVAEGMTSFEIKEGDNEYSHAKVLWLDKEHDIAALQLDVYRTDQPTDALSCSYTPRVGDQVEIVGNPLGFRLIHTWGRVASGLIHDERVNSAWASAFFIDGTVNPGNSGGPVFNKHGKVIGIAVGVILTPLGMSASLSGLSVIVPASTVCDQLRKHEEAVS